MPRPPSRSLQATTSPATPTDASSPSRPLPSSACRQPDVRLVRSSAAAATTALRAPRPRRYAFSQPSSPPSSPLSVTSPGGRQAAHSPCRGLPPPPVPIGGRRQVAYGAPVVPFSCWGSPECRQGTYGPCDTPLSPVGDRATDGRSVAPLSHPRPGLSPSLCRQGSAPPAAFRLCRGSPLPACCGRQGASPCRLLAVGRGSSPCCLFPQGPPPCLFVAVGRGDRQWVIGLATPAASMLLAGAQPLPLRCLSAGAGPLPSCAFGRG